MAGSALVVGASDIVGGATAQVLRSAEWEVAGLYPARSGRGTSRW